MDDEANVGGVDDGVSQMQSTERRIDRGKLETFLHDMEAKARLINVPDRRIQRVHIDDDEEAEEEEIVVAGPSTVNAVVEVVTDNASKAVAKSMAEIGWAGVQAGEPQTVGEQKQMVRERRGRTLAFYDDKDADHIYPIADHTDEVETWDRWLLERIHRQTVLAILSNMTLGHHPGVWLKEPTPEDEGKCIINVNGKKLLLVFEAEEFRKLTVNGSQSPRPVYGDNAPQLISSTLAQEQISNEQTARYGDGCRKKGYFELPGSERRGRQPQLREEVTSHNSPPYYWRLYINGLLDDVRRWATEDPISAEPPPPVNNKEQMQRTCDELVRCYTANMAEFVGRMERAYNMMEFDEWTAVHNVILQADGPRERTIVDGVGSGISIALPKRRPYPPEDNGPLRSKRSVSIERMDARARLNLKNSVDLPNSADKTIEMRERRRLVAELFPSDSKNFRAEETANREDFDLLMLGHVRLNTRISADEMYTCGNQVYYLDSVIDRRRGSAGVGELVIGADGHFTIAHVDETNGRQVMAIPMIHGATAETVNCVGIRAVVKNENALFCTSTHRLGTIGSEVLVKLRPTDTAKTEGTVMQCYRGFVWIHLKLKGAELAHTFVCCHQDYVDIKNGELDRGRLQNIYGIPIAFGESNTNVVIDQFVHVGPVLGLCVGLSESAASVVMLSAKKAVPVSLDNVQGITSFNYCQTTFDGRVMEDTTDLSYLSIQVQQEEEDDFKQATVVARMNDVLWMRQGTGIEGTNLDYCIDLNVDRVKIGVSQTTYNSREGWLLSTFEHKVNVQLYVDERLVLDGSRLAASPKGGIGLSNNEERFLEALGKEAQRLETCEQILTEVPDVVMGETDRPRLEMEADMLEKLAEKKRSLLARHFEVGM